MTTMVESQEMPCPAAMATPCQANDRRDPRPGDRRARVLGHPLRRGHPVGCFRFRPFTTNFSIHRLKGRFARSSPPPTMLADR